MRVLPALVCTWLLCAGVVFSQPAPPPLATNAPVFPKFPPRPDLTNLLRARLAQRATNAALARPVSNVVAVAPVAQPVPNTPIFVTNRLRAVPQIQPRPKLQPASYLAWDANSKATNVLTGMTNAHFSFWLTNVSTEEVLVYAVQTSCGCAVAQLPAYPWKLAPGSNGPIEVSVSLHGKMGSFAKSVSVDTSAGIKSLMVNITMPGSQGTPAGMDIERLKNMRMAAADRQIVFKGECAKCHSEPASGKTGEDLYVAACGICHDSPQRAALVPDLKNLNHPTSPEHWRKWIVEGKVGSMMPAFAKSAGGPLDEKQIESLVQLLTDHITKGPRTASIATNASLRLP